MAQAVPVPVLRPSTGFCVQTESTGNPPGRWYINMCKHKMVEMPIAYSGKIISREHVLTHGIGNMQVPFDVGSFRKLKMRADGAKKTTYCIDVVFNPFIIALFMDDEFCNAQDKYRPFIINLALKRIEESIGVRLVQQQVKLVKSLRYKDGEDGDATVPREFAELQGEQDSFDAEVPRKTQAAEPPPEPLIEDLTPGPKKPLIKKGFLNKGGSKLYGDEGSKEGVLPENAGDPMGWMPKKLRNTCKIVDTNAPDWQDHEKKKKSVEQHNASNKEFHDTLTKDMDKWVKAAQPDKWGEDLPEGTEAASAAQKYDVDYSRFDKIDFGEDESAAQDQRDWYYDANGNRREIERPTGSSSSTSTAGAAEKKSELQKGFLEKTKAPLYPKGSEQAKAPPDEEQFQKELESLLGDAKLREALGEEAGGSGPSKPPSPAAKTAAERKAPEFELKEVPEGLQLAVSVPGLGSMQGVNLDVTEQMVSLTFPASVSLKPLQVELPKSVVPTSARAKFSRKTQQINIALPVAVPGG
mmetsp:Transcript_2486/g.6690  ORF Transcript_2486/g.6690 Transcript_2486/m.6690 type:complete len:525 (-) Transcript_2486:72-1646(-)